MCRPVLIPLPLRHSTADGAAGSVASPVTNEYCRAGAFCAVMVTASGKRGFLKTFGIGGSTQ